MRPQPTTYMYIYLTFNEVRLGLQNCINCNHFFCIYQCFFEREKKWVRYLEIGNCGTSNCHMSDLACVVVETNTISFQKTNTSNAHR